MSFFIFATIDWTVIFVLIPFFITFIKIQTADCDLMTSTQPEILKLYRNLWQVLCPSVDKNSSNLPSGCWKQEFYCKGITSLTTCRSNMIIICFVKVRNVYHLFMQLRLRILIWEREWCTRSSTRMSQDIGIVCWYTCLQRGGMSLRNQIHSMLQQWHVCNTFHFLPNTLKYAENVSKKWQCWDSGNSWNFHTMPHIQELKFQRTKICDGVVLSRYSRNKWLAYQLSVFLGSGTGASIAQS